MKWNPWGGPPSGGKFPLPPLGGRGSSPLLRGMREGAFPSHGKARGSVPCERLGLEPGHHTGALPQSRRSSSHGCCQIPEHRMRSDCPSGLSLASGSGSIAAVRLRCRGEGVSLVLTGERGRELTTPAVGLRSRRCVVKPDPQRRMASPPGARRKGKGASPRPSPLYEVFLRENFLGCTCQQV